MGKLEGKIAVITGGSSGIGFATARLFAEEGAYVYITGCRRKAVDDAALLLGDRVSAVQGDVKDASDLDECFEQVKRDHGRLDALFANAGAADFVPLESIDDAHFEHIFQTNVRGLIYSVQKALPLMEQGGAIVLNGSIAASKGFPAHSIYSASKAAVRSLARTSTAELKARNIRGNVLSAGPTETEGIKSVFTTPEALNGWRSSAESMTPIGRVAAPEEVAKVALFLASQDSSFVAGAEVCVDGGIGQV